MIEKIADRAAIIVAGMHQFGAIGLARILDMSMGRVPQTHSIAIGQLNDQLLAARGMSWERGSDW